MSYVSRYGSAEAATRDLGRILVRDVGAADGTQKGPVLEEGRPFLLVEFYWLSGCR
ncbi:hypothetical protein GCM10022381_00030 [Leifsonia kafniensis]|uniref:Redoxin domain-containing protein n=1 Tax=Leifsonia kafniensis TaxID=475957 RepID=A0ABP7JY32_9MICO